MKHKPIHDRILILKIDLEFKSKSGLIFLGEIEKERETLYGKVVACGSGKRLVSENGQLAVIPMTVKVDDIIVCNARIPTKFNPMGEELWFLRESDVVEILEPDFEGEFAETEFKAEGYEFDASGAKILN